MSEVDPCAELEPIDELLEWWAANQHDICRGSQSMAKKYDELAEQVTDYRRNRCRLLTVQHILKQRGIPDIDGLRRLYPDLTRGLEAAHDNVELRGDVDRELDRLSAGGGGGGFLAQVRVTRWFYEAGFKIVDIEVKHEDGDGNSHTFDIYVEDVNGHGYDVEVWLPTGPRAHEERRVVPRLFLVGGVPCVDPGKWDPRMKYIAKLGGRGDDADANFRTLTRKTRQMREDRAGVVIACIERDLRPDVTLIPKEWGPRLPENRCVIALRIGDGGFTGERRGTGYLVCPPKFGHAETAKSMIESLKFEYVDYPAPLKYRWWGQ